MLKKTAVLLSIVLLFFGAVSAVSAEAAGYAQGCKVIINGQQIDLQSVDPSQLNKEVENIINNLLAQLKGPVPEQAKQHDGGTQNKQPAQPLKYEEPSKGQDPSPATNNQAGLTAEEQKMVQLVNQERQKQGLAPLKVNQELVKVARAKAQDMINNGYFSHHSPTYGSPAEMLNKFGVKYRYMGENLAGNSSVERAHQALMNSDGHRANILNGNFGQVGIGIVDGGPYGKMFVQLFTD
jgi:uncharacterized YkwD family protein